ncbi:hypothetical protein Rt10032_c09g3870 [Rhodotorula toruloides]|uniref:RNA-directed DNA polymerase n=1 Tax=Rhodotorula toruloides TaxID=5286 RepID=A0A511KHK2_RHOTO|nr:hypothetical protein Rt10032_c09g3870 [Rhodotorula toruloides]
MTTQVLQKETPASGEKQGETHVKQTPSPILGDRKEHGVVLEGGVVDANELTGNVSETESVQSRRSYADVAKGATGEAESREDSSEMSTPTPAEKSKSSSASPLVEKKAPTQHVPAGDDWQVAMSRSKKRGVKRIDSTELYDATRPIEKAREKSIFTELLKSYEGTIKNAKVLGVDVEADAAWVESTKSEVGNGVTPLRADELAADLRERHAALDKTFHGRAYRRVTEAEAVVQLADLRRKSRVARETEKRERRKLDAAAAVPASEKSGDGSADDSERDFSDEYRKFSEFRRRYRAEKEAERQKATGEAPVPNRAEPVVGEAKQSPAGGPAAPIRLDVDEAGEPSSLSSSSDSSESSGEGDSSQHSDGEGRRHRGHTANKKKREQKRRAKTSRSGVAPPSEPPSSSDSSSSGSDSDSSSDSRSKRRRKRESLRRREKEKVRRSSRKGRKGSESEDSRPALKVSAKVPIPEKYSGSDNRAKTLAKWTREVRTYLLSSNIDPDSLAAAGYISGCLKDRASELFSHQVIQDVNEQFLPGKGHRKSPWSWEQIVDLFKRKYVSVTAERDASRRFRELRQWKNNGTYVPVSELALQLEELGEEKHQTTDWELKRTFIDALEPEIAAKTFPLFANDFESVVVTYQMVVNEAITQEQVWMQEQAAKAARAKGANLSNYEAFSSSGVQARILSREGKKNARSGRIQSNKPNFRRRDRDRDDDESPMASSMTTGKGNRQSKNSSKQNGKKKSQLTEKEKRLRNERRSKNQCFDCGDEGHWAGECPKSQSRPKNGAIEVVDESDATEELLDSGSEVEKVADCDEETRGGNDAHLASVVCLPAELVGIDDLTLASAFTQGEETVFPRSFRVPVTIDGSAGHTATVDSGASTTFMHPATAVLRGIKALKYDKPRTLRLGTKGSRAKINAFCFAELTIGEVTRRQRFEIAQVEDEVLLGRDFLRAHKCSIRFDPDILIVYSRAGAPLKKVREEKLADVKLGAMKPTPPGPSEAEKRTFLRKIEREYSDVLRDDGAPLRAPPYRKVMHSIPFSVPEREEKRKITYKFPERFLSAFDKVCDAHVEAGIWIPATASYADPMIPLMKSDGVTPRPVVDLRRRNLVTKKLQMPVVDQDNIINAVAGSKFVTIMDIEGAFQQIRIVDEDVPKTAFSTPRGIFYSIAAQQETVTAPSASIVPDSWHAHKELVETILQRFRQHEFYLKKKKFRFCTNERDVLGRRVRDGRISIHESKAESILRLKKPANKKELQKVIGVFGFSSRHIPNYAQILAPLTELTGDVPFRWSKTCEDAFTELKRLVQLNLSLTHIRDDELAPADSRPVHHPDPPKDLVVQNEKKGKYLFLFSDASLTGCGSALCIGENWWTSELVGLQSKKFNPAQANYPTHEAELQGVFEAFKWFESKLLGRKVIVCTDNQALSNFLTAKKLNGRQARIWTYLSAFDFEIEYIKGERNVVADILSRIKDRSEDQHEQISAMNVGGRTKKLPARFKDAIVESDTPSPAKPSRQKMSADEARRQRAERRRERVLADREEAKKNVEDVPQEKERLDGEHQNEMYHAISREAPYERLGVDFQGPLPPSKWGSETATFLMNFVDTLTGECILIPCNETGLTAERCADLWFRFVYPQWGVPKELVSDQDVRWRSQFWRSMCQSLGTTLSMSTAYHPQSNGKVERLHRDLNAVLRQYVDVSQNDWAEAIPFAQHALNSRTSSTTGYSPFELSRLCPPSDLPTVAILSGYPNAIVSAQVRQTQGANRRRRKDPLSSAEMDAADPSYKGPPELWVSTKNLHATKGTARKLVPLFVGPFRVLRHSPRTSTYTLDLPAVYARKGYANVFHASQPDLIDAHLDENGVLRDSDGKEIEDGASLILDEAANVPLPAGNDPDLNSPSINDDERSAAAPEIVERVVKKLPKIKKTKAKRAATTAAATSGSGDATLASVAMDVDQPPAFTPPTPNPRFSSDVVMLNEDDISVTGHSSKGDNGVEVVTLFTNRLNRNDKVIIVKPRKFRTTQDEQLAAKDREIEQLRQLAHNAKSEVTKVEEDSEKLRKEIKKRDAQIAELEEDKRDLRQRCRYLENENGKKSEVLENQLRLEQLNGIKSNGVLDTTSKDALASQLFGTRVRSKREVYDEEAQRVRDATPISPYWAQPERPY